MTEDNKKVLYGAARRAKINRTMHDTIAECLELMNEKGVVRVIITDENGATRETEMVVRDLVVAKLTEALDTVAKLEAGTPL